MTQHTPQAEDNNKTAALDVLQSTFGYQSFRDGQEQVIDATLSGKDALVLLPTGVENPSAIKYQRYCYLGSRLLFRLYYHSCKTKWTPYVPTVLPLLF